MNDPMHDDDPWPDDITWEFLDEELTVSCNLENPEMCEACD